MLVFNSVFCALTSLTIYRIARRVFDETVAIWSDGLALSPYASYYSVAWIWETCLSAFLLSLLFMFRLEMEGDGRLSSWFRYALVWGIAALTNPAMLAWLPFSGCWLAQNLHRRAKHFQVPVVFSAVVFWLTLAPWLIRNYIVFGEPVFIRDNFGNELRAGNNPLAEGWQGGNYDASRNTALLKEMGEDVVYSEQANEAKAWFVQNPGRFLVLRFLRFTYFWAGLSPDMGWPSCDRAEAGEKPVLPVLVVTCYRRTVAGV